MPPDLGIERNVCGTTVPGLISVCSVTPWRELLACVRNQPDPYPRRVSIVKINAITVPRERFGEFERRFASRAGRVSSAEGFEAFERLSPLTTARSAS